MPLDNWPLFVRYTWVKNRTFRVRVTKRCLNKRGVLGLRINAFCACSTNTLRHSSLFCMKRTMSVSQHVLDASFCKHALNRTRSIHIRPEVCAVNSAAARVYLSMTVRVCWYRSYTMRKRDSEVREDRFSG